MAQRYWNVLDQTTSTYMLGGSVETQEEGEVWLRKYQQSYPHRSYSLVQVVFKYPPWWTSHDAEAMLKFISSSGKLSQYRRVKRP